MTDLYLDKDVADAIRRQSPLEHSHHASPGGAECVICQEHVKKWVTLWPTADRSKTARICIKNICGKLIFEDAWTEILIRAATPEKSSWADLSSMMGASADEADKLERAMIISKFKANATAYLKIHGAGAVFRGEAIGALLVFSGNPCASDLHKMKVFNIHIRELDGKRLMEELS